MHPTHAHVALIGEFFLKVLGRVGISEWREPQINLLADSLAGLGPGQQAIEKARAKRAHHILRAQITDVPAAHKRCLSENAEPRLILGSLRALTS